MTLEAPSDSLGKLSTGEERTGFWSGVKSSQLLSERKYLL
jgi:hypothetical protein